MSSFILINGKLSATDPLGHMRTFVRVTPIKGRTSPAHNSLEKNRYHFGQNDLFFQTSDVAVSAVMLTA